MERGDKGLLLEDKRKYSKSCLFWHSEIPQNSYIQERLQSKKLEANITAKMLLKNLRGPDFQIYSWKIEGDEVIKQAV